MDRIIVGLYDGVTVARQVVQDLIDAGFPRRHITMMAYDPEGEQAKFLNEDRTVVLEEKEGPEPAPGAVGGAIVGALSGLLVGVAIATLPGVGPLLVAGPIAAVLATGAGLAIGGLIGALMDAGIDREYAEYYVEAVRRGSTLVIVQTTEERQEEARRVIERHGPIDIDRRVASWQNRGWEGFDSEAKALSPAEVRQEQGYYCSLPSFHTHYQERLVGTDRSFSDYEPAYSYGCELAHTERYRGHQWDEIEPEASRDWKERSGDAWDEVREAVRHAWEEIRE